MSEETRVLGFVGAVFSVFALAGFFLVRSVYRRWKRLENRDSKAVRIFSRVTLGLATLGILCVTYGFIVEPYWPQVTHQRLVSGKIKSRIRIVHISDIHSDPKGRLEEKLPSLIAAEKPDFIVYTGDSMNSEDAAPVFLGMLEELTKIGDVYIARGNWDIGLPNEFFTQTGAKIVDGLVVRTQVRGQKISISGVRVGNELAIPVMLEALPADEFSVFLHHWPDEILEVAASGKVDLYCAGHTHGGQVALPLYGALITLSRFGKKYEAGLYKVRGTALYVNRGIGMEGGAAFRVRFFARPEITVIDLVPQS
ncbi:MAG TPA: metallophosphoesterase [Terriglobales bacterium]|nr:metallophosphoesterase [Terriglobales bacterium]